MSKFQLIVAVFVMVPMIVSLQQAYAISENNIGTSNIWKTSVNKQIQLVADVTNNQSVKQPFVYIVQVLDGEGKSVMVTWIQGILQPHQSMSPSQSWIPEKPGVYTAQIFNWPCLDLCGALSYPLEMKIIVT